MDVSDRLKFFGIHLGLTLTDRQRDLRDRDIRTDSLTNIKTDIHAMLLGATGIQGHQSRVFGLSVRGNTDTIIFVPTLRFDLASNTLVAEAYALPLNRDRLAKVKKMLSSITGKMLIRDLWADGVADWKRLLPALAERCRTWKHGPNCEFLAKNAVPLSLEHENDPLCSCGKGKDISEAFMKEKKWESAIPFVTRIAIGPLFGVPYVEDIGDPMNLWRQQNEREAREQEYPYECAHCGGPGKPKLLRCAGCKSAHYCSAGCQKEDWKMHKLMCKK
jgi:hypothetical protein